MNIPILKKLAGEESEFSDGLVDLGWFSYPPRLVDYDFRGNARKALNPTFKSAGKVGNTNAHVYRLTMEGSKWRDAMAVVESQLKQKPQFAVVFCSIPGELLIMVPADPDKAKRNSPRGLEVDCIHLDLLRTSNFETEIIDKLKKAPRHQFGQRLQALVNTEKVTKKFYNEFKKKQEDFKARITGITIAGDQAWYSSVMLNRLMFIYFLQRKGFLNGEERYLSNRLKMVQERRGRDHFQSFYRSFLLRLFHDKLGSSDRDSGFDDLFGSDADVRCGGRCCRGGW